MLKVFRVVFISEQCSDETSCKSITFQFLDSDKCSSSRVASLAQLRYGKAGT